MTCCENPVTCRSCWINTVWLFGGTLLFGVSWIGFVINGYMPWAAQ